MQILDGLRRWRLAVLDEDSVGLDQAVVIGCRVPAELFLEGGFGFVVAFDGGGAGGGPINVWMPSMSHWGEAGLDVDDQEGLVHGRLRGGRGDGGADAVAGFCGGLAGDFAGKPAPAGGAVTMVDVAAGVWGGLAGVFAGKPAHRVRVGLWNTEPQMQQNPHWAGFGLLRIWWAGVI